MTLPAEPRFVSIEAVLRLHAFAIEDQGGDPGMRDRGLLESAMAMPRQQFDGNYLHPTIPVMAAAYAFHICKNHPFIDGNKRAATAAMIKFLNDNGWKFDASADEAEPAILDLAAGVLSKDQFSAWLAPHCHLKPSLELRELFQQLKAIDIYVASDAMDLSKSPELIATIREAQHAMPVLTEMEMLLLEHHAHGRTEEARAIANSTRLLLILYRIAEDMGYEW